MIPSLTGEKNHMHKAILVKHTFSIVSLNCQSIRNKVLSVLSYLSDNSVDVAVMQETWLSDTDVSVYNEFEEYGFKYMKKSRKQNRSGGGLVILFNPQLKLKELTLDSSTTFETFEYMCSYFKEDKKRINLIIQTQSI